MSRLPRTSRGQCVHVQAVGVLVPLGWVGWRFRKRAQSPCKKKKQSEGWWLVPPPRFPERRLAYNFQASRRGG